MTKIYGFFPETGSGFRDCFRLTPEDALSLMRQHALDMMDNEDASTRPSKLKLEEIDLEQTDAHWLMRLINLGPMAVLEKRRSIATFDLDELTTKTASLPVHRLYRQA